MQIHVFYKKLFSWAEPRISYFFGTFNFKVSYFVSYFPSSKTDTLYGHLFDIFMAFFFFSLLSNEHTQRGGVIHSLVDIGPSPGSWPRKKRLGTCSILNPYFKPWASFFILIKHWSIIFFIFFSVLYIYMFLSLSF